MSRPRWPRLAPSSDRLTWSSALDAENLLPEYRRVNQLLLSFLTLDPHYRRPRTALADASGVSLCTAHPITLERCRWLLKKLGNPEQRLRFVHVTGTSGKGSTVAALHAIAQASGVRVGSLCSPHITTPLERIRVDGGLLSVSIWLDVVEELKPVLQEAYLQGPYGMPSYHDIFFALALLAFVRLKVELAIIEVGIGGRWDSTNVIPSPLVAIITDVGLDHQEILGHDHVSIARDKAGILKPGSVGLSGVRHAGAAQVVVDEAARHRIPLWQVPDTIQYQVGPSDLCIQTPLGVISGISAGLTGEHQQRNIALAVAAAHQLAARGFSITTAGMKEGLRRTFLPARCEPLALEDGRVLVLDMAHNPDKIAALCAWWRSFTGEDRPTGTAVVSVASDKDWPAVLSLLGERFSHISLTRPLSSLRAMVDPLQLMHEAKRLGLSTSVWLDPRDAILNALARDEGAVAVTGSTYLVGEVRSALIDEEQVLRGRWRG